MTINDIRNELNTMGVKFHPNLGQDKLEAKLQEAKLAVRKRFRPQGTRVSQKSITNEYANLMTRVSITSNDPAESSHGTGVIINGNGDSSKINFFNLGESTIMQEAAVSALDTRIKLDTTKFGNSQEIFNFEKNKDDPRDTIYDGMNYIKPNNRLTKENARYNINHLGDLY